MAAPPAWSTARPGEPAHAGGTYFYDASSGRNAERQPAFHAGTAHRYAYHDHTLPDPTGTLRPHYPEQATTPAASAHHVQAPMGAHGLRHIQRELEAQQNLLLSLSRANLGGTVPAWQMPRHLDKVGVHAQARDHVLGAIPMSTSMGAPTHHSNATAGERPREPAAAGPPGTHAWRPLSNDSHVPGGAPAAGAPRRKQTPGVELDLLRQQVSSLNKRLGALELILPPSPAPAKPAHAASERASPGSPAPSAGQGRAEPLQPSPGLQSALCKARRALETAVSSAGTYAQGAAWPHGSGGDASALRSWAPEESGERRPEGKQEEGGGVVHVRVECREPAPVLSASLPSYSHLSSLLDSRGGAAPQRKEATKPGWRPAEAAPGQPSPAKGASATSRSPAASPGRKVEVLLRTARKTTAAMTAAAARLPGTSPAGSPGKPAHPPRAASPAPSPRRPDPHMSAERPQQRTVSPAASASPPAAAARAGEAAVSAARSPGAASPVLPAAPRAPPFPLPEPPAEDTEQEEPSSEAGASFREHEQALGEACGEEGLGERGGERGGGEGEGEEEQGRAALSHTNILFDQDSGGTDLLADQFSLGDIGQEAEKAEVEALKEALSDKERRVVALSEQLQESARKAAAAEAAAEAAAAAHLAELEAAHERAAALESELDARDLQLAEMGEAQELLKCEVEELRGKLEAAGSQASGADSVLAQRAAAAEEELRRAQAAHARQDREAEAAAAALRRQVEELRAAAAGQASGAADAADCSEQRAGSPEERLHGALHGLRGHLVELRDAIAQSSADSIGDDCVIC
eukprot:jgi/Tetstr1/423265/TSEL_013965.t1